uniref:CID domain-containing protein n=1 Tax=Amphilophus citrinellus TaxID=61819 RepID=A0A3Q0TAZ4_AMPCI
MDASAAREDACREYQSSLEDLTFNSKPHINMLTILAEENINFAKDIVAIIEAQISKVFMNIEYFHSELVFRLLPFSCEFVSSHTG